MIKVLIINPQLEVDENFCFFFKLGFTIYLFIYFLKKVHTVQASETTREGYIKRQFKRINRKITLDLG